MQEHKVIIAGGRDFNDPELLSRVMFAMAETEFADLNVSLVSGGAKGADKLGYEFAKQYNIHCDVFHADWNAHGKRAGFIRNEVMGRFADRLIAFHDGRSPGTAHMIAFMKRMGKPVTVISY